MTWYETNNLLFVQKKTKQTHTHKRSLFADILFITNLGK